VELLWIENLSCPSPAPFIQDHWRELVLQKNIFVTLLFVKQTIAFAKGQVVQFQKSPARTKKIYNALRLLYQARRAAKGKNLKIFLSEGSKKRAEIMKIREKIKEGDVDLEFKENLVNVANSIISEIDSLKPWKVPDNVDEIWLQDWLLRLRKKQVENK
jgi:hypothetical protein